MMRLNVIFRFTSVRSGGRFKLSVVVVVLYYSCSISPVTSVIGGKQTILFFPSVLCVDALSCSKPGYFSPGFVQVGLRLTV